ncbi:MAG: cysteine synthase A [Elusimicrobia bacterium HGW-Elusimicrobia-2]|nr:MAG: cysteine synthase A [Elusimicrobia bacterium HGW-Elusimicrobia-2]
MKLAKNVLTLVGNTPMAELRNLGKDLPGRVLAKLEYFNPGGSIKDRIALYMIEDAEKRGLLKKGGFVVEPTSGNTGIGLAMVCAVKGYSLTVTMPESASEERRKFISSFGAEVILTPASGGMREAIKKAEELSKKTKGAFMPRQFENPANPDAHRKTTAEEIWTDTDGKVDIVVAGVGTGGTITGIGEALKKRKPSLKIVAVEPASSAVLSGNKPGPHTIEGIGAGFIPKVLNRKIIDEIIKVSDEEAKRTARALAEQEGIFAGISSGAAAAAALILAGKEENRGKCIVVIFPDSGDRYIAGGLFS